MKRKMKLKNFFAKKKVAAGCIAAAAIIAAGSYSMIWQSSDIPELSSYTDPVIETTLTGDDTPLASKPKVTTKTTTKTKTTKKKVKLKKASKKSYTKKLPTKKKTSTKTKKKSNETVKTQTVVQTATTEKYTKKSQQKLVTQKVTTTVTTTTVEASGQGVQADVTSTSTQAAGNSANTSKYTVSNVASIAPQMDSRVLSAYSRMGFTVTVDPGASFAGHFDARSRSITLQQADDTVYHELGHYLAFIAGNVDQTSEFAAIYNSEKSAFTGYNKAYATQNASEYFAESVKDYVLNADRLSSQRPNTYKAIEAALEKVTNARVDAIMRAYSAIWN